MEDACAAQGFRVHLAAVDEAPLHVEASFVALGPLALASSRTSPLAVTRTLSDIREDRSEVFVLPLHQGGDYQLSQSGSDDVLGSTGTRLIAGNRPYTLTQRANAGLGQIETLAIPAGMLRSRVSGVDDLIRTRLDATGPAGAFLRDYLRLAARHAAADPAVSAIAGHHALDLVSLLLSQSGKAQREAEEQAADAMKTVRLGRLMAVMQRLAVEPGLTLDGVAVQMKLSRRSVQMLFSQMQTSFSAELARLRIEHARGLLCSPDAAGMSIADIGFAAGFSDLSTFNRTFRKAFGVPPGAFRHRAADETMQGNS